MAPPRRVVQRGAGIRAGERVRGRWLDLLRDDVAAFRLGKRARIFRTDAIPFVERLEAGAYDIVFADPPYGSRKADRVIMPDGTQR